MDQTDNIEIGEIRNTNTCLEETDPRSRPYNQETVEHLYQPELIAKNPKDGTCIFLYVSAFSANLLSFAMGLSFSWTSPVIPKLQEILGKECNPLPEAITKSNESWIASLLYIGATIGPLIVGMATDKIGRKRTLLVSALPLLISFLVLAFATRVELYYFARFLGGLTCGGISGVLPLYLHEISESHNRGMITSMFTVSCNLGVWFSYLIGPYVSIKIFCLICTVPIFMFSIVFGFFIPESPVYLISIKDCKGALESLRILRKKNMTKLQMELTELTVSMEEVQANKSSPLQIFKSKVLVKALMISVGLVSLTQFCGMVVVQSFIEPIFLEANSIIPADLASIFVGGVQVVVVIIITSVVVDNFGRRLLLLISSFVCCLSFLALGLYFYLKVNNIDAVSDLSWLPLASLIIYMVGYNIGLASIPWVIMAEIFTSNIASIAVTISAFTFFLVTYFIMLVFPYLKSLMGPGPTFWLFGVFCAITFVFVLFAVIETKGKSLAEIQQCLSEKNKSIL